LQQFIEECSCNDGCRAITGAIKLTLQGIAVIERSAHDGE